MIKINYQNFQVDFQSKKHREMLADLAQTETPAFEKIKTDLTYIKKNAAKYKKYKNIILIGNGGSRTSGLAFYNSLFTFRNKVHFEFLSSAEPELIHNIRKNFSKKDTLVLIISKSGDNINALEPLMQLIDYPVLVITGEKGNTLSQIAKIKKWDIIMHPEVGGRYSGLTTCGLVPAFLMGLPIEKIYAGAESGYKKFNVKKTIENNDALKLAYAFWQLEEKGYVEIFASLYSTALSGFFPLLVQLLHESIGKDGKGQTIYGDYSPESQHHTMQRFFGGRKNVLGMFWGVEKPAKDTMTKIPKNIAGIRYRGQKLADLAGITGSETMNFDRHGVIGHCVKDKVPAVEILISQVTPETMGEFMVFWQYFAMYSALLRDQNPFDQPEVEHSKILSFDLRTKGK